MKKLLALVLALVMSMSLVTISNAAFKDADSIDYKEAVDVMNAVGVFIGDEKGNFNAKENLTREQAAKIIAYLELGDKAADALVGSATFTDVAATRWSAGFVSYCAQAGVVAGYDGKFDPAGQLTALQFGKMLLVEIGYDAKAAGMVGTDWAINTSKLLATTGLMNGIDGSVNQVLTREKAAQMCLNALKTPTVEYATKGSNITVNGAEINFGASVPTYVTNTLAKYQTISKDKLTNSDEYTIELGEKLFKKLALNDVRDDFDRPAHEWKLGTTVIGTYENEADLEYTTGASYKTVIKDLGLSKNSKTTEYYKNGKEQANVTIVKTDDDTKFGGNGVRTQIWYNDDNGNIIVSEIDTFVAKVGSVTKATSTADRYVTLKPYTAKLAGLNTKFETEAFAKDDLVTYTAAENSEGRYDIKTVSALTASTNGTLTEWNGKARTTDSSSVGNSKVNFTIDSTLYKYSKNFVVVNEDGAESNVYDFEVDKAKLNVYTDAYGYALYISGVEAAKNYAAVIGVGQSNQYGSQTRGVTLLLPDGTQKEVKAKITDNNWTVLKGVNADESHNLVSDGIGEVVTYTVGDDDIYTLTLAGNKYNDDTITDTDVKFTNGKSEMTFDNGANHKYVTSETVFFVATNKTLGDSSKGINYNVYTGYANMPSLASIGVYGYSVYYNTEYKTQIDYVYLYADHLDGISGVDTYFVKAKNADITTDSKGSYYTLPAIVDGEETTVMIDAKTLDTKLGYNGTTVTNATTEGVFAIDNVVKSSKGIIVSYNDVTNATTFNASNGKATGTVAANKVVVGIGTSIDGATYWAYDKDTEVYMVSEKFKTITVATVADIETDSNDYVYAIRNSVNKVLTQMVIVDVKDEVLNNDASLKSVTVKGVKATADENAYTVTVPYAKQAATDTKWIDIVAKDANASVKVLNDAEVDVTAGTQATVAATGSYAGQTVKYTIKVTAADGVTKETYTLTVVGLTESQAVLKSSNVNAVVNTTAGAEAITVSGAPTVADLYSVLSINNDNAGKAASFKIVNAWGTELAKDSTTPVAATMKVVLTRDNVSTGTVTYSITVS